MKVPVTRRVLVISGEVAGIQAALDLADAGYEVIPERTIPLAHDFKDF